MKFKTLGILFTAIIFSFVKTSAIPVDDDPLFPTPAILEDNVAFWIKIYTEIPMKKGLLHDRDYPLVIFEELTAGYRSKILKKRKRIVTTAIKKMNSTPKSKWGTLEKHIFEQYAKHGDTTDLKDAHTRIRFQQGQMERYQEGLRRSGHYLDTIRNILTRYKVPLRLAYLPHVESSFNTEAYSKVGAAGLWQFMRGTGKLYGMKINYIIDERRDPILATIGAAKYLSSSYKTLHTWPLAITSYNHGVYGMKRAVKQTGSRDFGVIVQKYKSRSFRFASSNFYSCFIAASHVAAHHTRYFPGVTLNKPLKYTDFTIQHYITADDFCTFMNIPQKQLRQFNPAIRPGVFSKHRQLPKDFVLHIPGVHKPSELVARYTKIPDSLKKDAPPRPKYYRVNRGDNLYAISSRLGVSVSELAYENNITRINRIRAGQVLRIPVKATKTTAPVEVASAKPQEEKSKPIAAPQDTAVEVALADITVPPTKEKTEQNSAAMEIARAEAVASIPPEEIPEKATAAPVQKDNVKPPPSTPPATAATVTPPAMSDSLKEIAFAPAIVEEDKKSNGKPRIGSLFDVAVYNLDAVLKPGGTTAKITVSIDETIGHYADWLGIATWRIRRLNRMGRRSTIVVNRSLLIPIDRPDALEQFAAARLEYHMALEEDFYAQYTIAEVTPYKMKRGETLWDICNNSDNPLPLWLLAKYNQQTDIGRLMVGTRLWIPQVRELTDEEIEMLRNGRNVDESRPVEPLKLKMEQRKLVP